MWESIKTFYTEHKLYVNIGLGLLAVIIGYRILRKK